MAGLRNITSSLAATCILLTGCGFGPPAPKKVAAQKTAPTYQSGPTTFFMGYAPCDLTDNTLDKEPNRNNPNCLTILGQNPRPYSAWA